MERIKVQEPPRQAGYLRHHFAPYPRQVRLETSSVCNMKCKPCSFHGWRNPAPNEIAIQPSRVAGRMPDALFEQAIEDLAGWPIPLRELAPTNFGELFMHPHWFRLLQLAERRLPKTKIALPTTGVLVTDAVLEKLVQIKTLAWLNVSVNAFFAETYERFHGVSASHLPRIRVWVERFKVLRPDVALNFSMIYDPVRHGQSEMERDLFLRYWAPLGSVTINTTTYVQGDGKPSTVTLPCRSIFDGLTVFDDGRVGTACCFDGNAALVVGTFPGEKLLDIWNGPKLRELGQLHNEGRRGEIDLCRGCSFA